MQTPPLLCKKIARYYQVLHPQRSFFEVFLRCVWRCFLFFRSRISDDESRCLCRVCLKKIVLDTENGVLLYIIVQYLPPSPPLLPTTLRNIFFPRPPSFITFIPLYFLLIIIFFIIIIIFIYLYIYYWWLWLLIYKLYCNKKYLRYLLRAPTHITLCCQHYLHTAKQTTKKNDHMTIIALPMFMLYAIRQTCY